MKIVIDIPFTERQLKGALHTSIEDDKRKGLLPTTKEEWEQLNEDRKSSNWKRHIVDNGYNADWKCTKCGYVCKLDFPPMECPKCMGGNN